MLILIRVPVKLLINQPIPFSLASRIHVLGSRGRAHLTCNRGDRGGARKIKVTCKIGSPRLPTCVSGEGYEKRMVAKWFNVGKEVKHMSKQVKKVHYVCIRV